MVQNFGVFPFTREVFDRKEKLTVCRKRKGNLQKNTESLSGEFQFQQLQGRVGGGTAAKAFYSRRD